MTDDDAKRGVALSSVAASGFMMVAKLTVGLLTGSIGILAEAARHDGGIVAAQVVRVDQELALERPKERQKGGILPASPNVYRTPGLAARPG